MSFAVVAAPWSEQAERELVPAAHGEIAAIRADVTSGAAILWRVTGSSEGWLVTRLEDRELVIVAGAGRNSLPVLVMVRDRAAAAGLSIRTHIRRPGLMRLYERLGFTERERVFHYGRQE